MATVQVKAIPQKGFYRTGLKFTREPRKLTVGKGKDVTEEQLEILKAEPMLVVEEVKEATKAAGGNGQAGDKSLSKDMKADEAIAAIGWIEDPDEVKKFVKGDERSTVNDAAKSRIDALKK